MASLQHSPYAFFDLALSYAAEHRLLSATLRETLAKQLLQGSLQVLDALFPGRVCTTQILERVFASVRLVVGYGLYQSSSGDPGAAWQRLNAEGVFALSRAGAEVLFPYFLKDPFLDEHNPYQLFAYTREHPASNLLVYKTLAKTGSAPPESTAQRILSRAVAAEAAYVFAQAQYALFSAHDVECLDAAGKRIGGVAADVMTLQILLHRALHGGTAPFPRRVDMDANLRAYLAACASGALPWDFDDPAWQEKALPEIPEPELRARVCKARCDLPLLQQPVSENDRILFTAIWSGIGFPHQTHLSRLQETLDTAQSQALPFDDLDDAARWGPYLLSCALHDAPAAFPETGREKRLLLAKLRDSTPDWPRVFALVQRTFGPGSGLERWVKDRLIPEARERANQLRRLSEDAAHDKSYAAQVLDDCMTWLLDMQADL